MARTIRSKDSFRKLWKGISQQTYTYSRGELVPLMDEYDIALEDEYQSKNQRDGRYSRSRAWQTIRKVTARHNRHNWKNEIRKSLTHEGYDINPPHPDEAIDVWYFW